MRLRILGSGAGGGVPQWNCACPNCVAARTDPAAVKPRTQDAIALSPAEGAWYLINASPDILRQLEATPALHPRAPRTSPFQGILLTNGDLDHVLGLFSLRESTRLVLYATDSVRRGLEEGNVLFRTLKRFPEQVTWRRFALDEPTELTTADGAGTGVTVLPVALPGKVPTHLMGLREPSPEDNIGLWIRDERTGKLAVQATAVGALGAFVERMAGADLCLFDGTFWSSDELVRLGLSSARAESMAHLPIGGPSGSLALLAGVPLKRRIYTHINNTNPILRAGAPEGREVVQAGWEIAEDGLEIEV
jgi:pyrroloquinoline quinone biosynthesis protein B